MPDKMIEMTGGLIEPVLFQTKIDDSGDVVDAAENPVIDERSGGVGERVSGTIGIHQNKSRRVPNFIGKVSIAFNAVFR